MTKITDKDRIDSLIKHFWKNGFLTISRKHGIYLPEPNPIGEYEVDAVGKLNKKYVLGITLTKEDLKNPNILKKITFLANQKSKYSMKKVTLFIGCSEEIRPEIENFLLQINEDLRKNIKIVTTTNNDV